MRQSWMNILKILHFLGYFENFQLKTYFFRIFHRYFFFLDPNKSLNLMNGSHCERWNQIEIFYFSTFHFPELYSTWRMVVALIRLIEDVLKRRKSNLSAHLIALEHHQLSTIFKIAKDILQNNNRNPNENTKHSFNVFACTLIGDFRTNKCCRAADFI